MGGLVWATFLGVSLPGWDSISSSKVDLDLSWIPISSSIGVKGHSRSPVEASEDKG